MTNINLLEAHLRRAYLSTILKPLRKQKTVVACGSRPRTISHLVPKVTNSSLVFDVFKLLIGIFTKILLQKMKPTVELKCIRKCIDYPF